MLKWLVCVEMVWGILVQLNDSQSKIKQNNRLLNTVMFGSFNGILQSQVLLVVFSKRHELRVTFPLSNWVLLLYSLFWASMLCRY